MNYYAILLAFSLIMLSLTSIIMAKLNNSTNFPAKSDDKIGSMKTVDYIGMMASLVILLWCGYKLYRQYQKNS